MPSVLQPGLVVLGTVCCVGGERVPALLLPDGFLSRAHWAAFMALTL